MPNILRFYYDKRGIRIKIYTIRNADKRFQWLLYVDGQFSADGRSAYFIKAYNAAFDSASKRKKK